MQQPNQLNNILMDLNLENLISPQTSTNSLVRYEDATDQNTPRLNYSVPLPGSFQGKFYLDTDFFNADIPWKPIAFRGTKIAKKITDFAAALENNPNTPLPEITDLVMLPKRTHSSTSEGSNTQSTAIRNTNVRRKSIQPNISFTVKKKKEDGSVEDGQDQMRIKYNDKEVGISEIAAAAKNGKVPFFYNTFGGSLAMDFVQEAQSEEKANPRFFIIEHYRLSSFFEDYGAGKTVGVFSLMPGEETTLYIRNWRKTEESIKEASSIFDSYTEEAADEFEHDIQSEITDTDSESKNRVLHAKFTGSSEINFGLKKFGAKTKHTLEAGINTETNSARETVSKNVDKVNRKHSSKASSKRETEVTQELEKKVEQEYERITERKIKNTNLSRTLNIVTRELNQEFTNYFALTDVTLAFVNDRNKIETFQLNEIDQMLEKYVKDVDTGGIISPDSPFGTQTPKQFLKRELLQQINEVYDFRGTRHDCLEEVDVSGETEQAFRLGESPNPNQSYVRIRRNRTADSTNPFYADGDVPVQGIVMSQNKYTIRTSAVIIDSLLGHGIALDNYALGMQQETLRELQLKNNKVELAMQLIQSGNTDALEAYRSLFGSVDQALLEEMISNT